MLYCITKINNHVAVTLEASQVLIQGFKVYVYTVYIFVILTTTCNKK